MNPIHTTHNGHPVTYLVFGPYGDEWDIEVHNGHVANNGQYAQTYSHTITVTNRT